MALPYGKPSVERTHTVWIESLMPTKRSLKMSRTAWRTTGLNCLLEKNTGCVFLYKVQTAKGYRSEFGCTVG